MGLHNDDPISMQNTLVSQREPINLLSSVENSSIENDQKMDAKLARSNAGQEPSPELAHPPIAIAHE